MTLENKQPHVGFDPAGVPEELRMLPRWICWRYEVRDGKETKVPISPKTSKLTDATKLANGHPLAEALQALEKDSSLAGIGFLLGDGIAGIDLDDCIDEHGTLSAPAESIVDEFASYTEYSPSGTGVKIFIRGKKPAGVTGCTTPGEPGLSKIEVYDQKRYFAVTGHRIEDSPATVNDLQAALVGLCARLWPEKELSKATAASSRSSPAQGFQGSDNELIQCAIAAKHGEVFRDLWNGDTTKYNGDESVADLALCGKLAFWTGKDRERMDRLFRTSGLFRPKWDAHRGEKTYGQMTIGVAIESCREVYSARRPRSEVQEAGIDQRPEICIDSEEHSVNSQAIAALASDSEIYQRGGRLVRVVAEETPEPGITRQQGSLTIGSIELPNLRERLTLFARFVRVRNGNTVPAHPTPWMVQAISGRAQWDKIRVLASVSTTPVLRPDGTLFQTEGYDSATHVLYAPSERFPTIPETPTQKDVRAALDLLNDLIQDFNFETEAHRSSWIAYLLTALGRPAFQGPAPLFLIDANIRGAGKSLLAQIAGRIVLGRNMPVSSYSHEPEELRKRITSVALAGDVMVLFDNIEGRFGNATLDRALTTTRWRDRVLGSNGMVDLPLNVVWCATGNNVVVGADTARRIIHVRLDVLEQRPEERTGFRHENILEHARLRRADLVVAGLTILRAYIAAGRPKAEIKPMGSFEGWSDLIRQAVIWAGEPDPCLTREGLALTSDSAEESLGQVLEALHGYPGIRDGFVLGPLLEHLYGEARSSDAPSTALRAAFEAIVGSPAGRPPTARQVGAKFKHYRRRPVNGMYLDADESASRRDGLPWKVTVPARGGVTL